jgi:hypothetical protein
MARFLQKDVSENFDFTHDVTTEYNFYIKTWQL